jgi:hypothetical protein
MLGMAVNKKSLVSAFLTVILIGGFILASVMFLEQYKPPQM